MRNAHRPTGRFFCLLMLAAVPLLAAPADSLGAPPASPITTQVVDTVYRADGIFAKGTVLISWPAFTTADGYAVAAGSLSVLLGSGGAFSASLAPNTGAQPAGVYYKVIYQLAGQEPSTEYWVVPATGSVSIGSVRAKLMPPTIAAQVLTRDVADTNYVHVNGDSTVNGNITLTSLTAQTINSAVYVQCPNCTDWAAAIQAAFASCPTNAVGYKSCQLILPRVDNGAWRSSLTINSPAVSLKGQGRSATTFSCSVSADCFLYQPIPFTITEGGTFSDFSITGTSAAGQNLIHVRDSIGATFERISLDGANASDSVCVAGGLPRMDGTKYLQPDQHGIQLQ